MIDSPRVGLPDFLPAALQQDLSNGTRHSWESSAFKGLFESHLSASGSPSEGDGPAHSHGGSGLGGNSSAQVRGTSPRELSSGAGREPAAVEGENAPGAQAQGDMDAGSNIGIGLLDAPSYPLELVSADEGDVTAVHAPTELPSGWGASPTSQIRVTVFSRQDSGELYIRLPGVDVESALEFAKSAEQILREQRLSLGRVKLNGQVIWGEDASGEQSRLSA